MSGGGKALAYGLDAVMCAMMYALQWRHRLPTDARELLERYIASHESSTRDAYFRAPALNGVAKSATSPAQGLDFQSRHIRWQSPVETAHPENNRVHVDLYRCPEGWKAPTAIMLHALMSASDIGYRRWAADFNARGWNACFLHLPYHYSRKPRGFSNGELAITADLVRTAEGLRQGVSEARQLMAALRERGCREFGLWTSSYGGWIGALLASVESDFRYVTLMEPIVDVTHAIWISPAGLAVRRGLTRRGIDRALVERHFSHVSPLHSQPLCGSDRVIFCGGSYDHIAPVEPISRLHELWRGSELLQVQQGHFGYRMMPTVWRRLVERGWL